ncbi:MAG: RNA chaperone Hfq [Clostridia bacterium]|nr:RNA chaperone Hfq [Clostridia bacterium]
MGYSKTYGYGQDGPFPPASTALSGRREHSGARINIQDAFLNHCRREKVVVEITIFNNTVRTGIIAGFDNAVIALEIEGRQQLVFKSAIMIINPVENVNYIFNEAYRPETYRTDGSRTNPEYPNDFA